jgi:hypothetical protein
MDCSLVVVIAKGDVSSLFQKQSNDLQHNSILVSCFRIPNVPSELDRKTNLDVALIHDKGKKSEREIKMLSGRVLT